MIALIYWKEIALGLALSLAAAFFGLWRHEVSSYSDYRAQIEAQAKAQEEHVKTVVTEQKRITDETANAWARNLDAVRAYYRLRQPGPGQVPAVPAAPTGTDAEAADAIPSTGIVAGISLDALEQQCAEETLRLISLQDWIKQQQVVK